MKTKVIAFDVFGTVFDLSQVDREEVRDYVNHIHEPNWRPLYLPESWENLKAHPDAAEGIKRLRENFMVVTLSNGPVSLLTKISKNNKIDWDLITPIELKKVYKPKREAYLTVCEVMRVKPDEVLMITANETFGDLEASRSLGMEAILIRSGAEKGPIDIIELNHLMLTRMSLDNKNET